MAPIESNPPPSSNLVDPNAGPNPNPDTGPVAGPNGPNGPGVGAGVGDDPGGTIEGGGGSPGFDCGGDAWGDNDMPPGQPLNYGNAEAAATETGQIAGDGSTASWMFAMLQVQKILAKTNMKIAFTETDMRNKSLDAQVDAFQSKFDDLMKNVHLEKTLGWAKIGTDIGTNLFGTCLGVGLGQNRQGSAQLFSQALQVPGQVIDQSKQVQTDTNSAQVEMDTSDATVAGELHSNFDSALQQVNSNASTALQHLENFNNVAGGLGSVAANKI
ncbi:MAG: hypothetical protein AAGG47_04210 [Pseudomonadota bacterium]